MLNNFLKCTKKTQTNSTDNKQLKDILMNTKLYSRREKREREIHEQKYHNKLVFLTEK